MFHRRVLLVPLLICAVIGSGCQTDRTATVAEYRPVKPVTIERKAPAAAVFELVRWQPAAASSLAPADRVRPPSRQIPVEMQRRYLDLGQPVGFARREGQLIAIAGDTAVPLMEAHYEWKTVAPAPGPGPDLHVLGNTGAELFVIGLSTAGIAAIFLAIHNNRHRLTHVLECD